MTFAMINACGTEGSGEYAIFYSGDSSLTVNGTDIDFRYGTSSPASTTMTESFAASGNSAFVTALNNNLTGGCDMVFVNAPAGTNIPEGSRFLIFDANPTDTADFDNWCGNSLGSVYVLFSTDASWSASGNFANSSSSQRFFRTILKNDTTDYDYTGSSWSPNQDGNYATWNSTGGSPASYGNFASCAHSNGVALPVSWLFVNATSSNQEVTLNWATATELNNDYFTIERCTDGHTWEPIGLRAGAGTSKSRQEYSFVDDQPANGHTAYRIRQTDFNGVFDFSEKVMVNRNEAMELAVYPNPASERLFIQPNPEGYIAQLQLISSTGQVLKTASAQPGQTMEWVLSDVPSGLYFLHIQSNNQSQVKQIVRL